jgi:hypothetical protein
MIKYMSFKQTWKTKLLENIKPYLEEIACEVMGVIVWVRAGSSHQGFVSAVMNLRIPYNIEWLRD